MSEKKRLYFYSNSGISMTKGDVFNAMLTTPLSQFPHVDGCSSGKNRDLLTNQNIGKRFKVSIFDPYEIGDCELLGFGIDVVGDEEMKKEFQGDETNLLYLTCFAFFKIVETGEILAVEANKNLDVEPLF
ncbi:MAG: hypothetical protein LiPW41_683 [Parcubacteria group bacterium LiPW_41]|nr:MAG: hypothetical protein LiPW41_683 [Parcubacteria group bacterium LiPW_41]